MATPTTRIDPYKIPTEFHEETNTIVHTTRGRDPETGHEVRLQTVWKREKKLGAGTFGQVWCEKEEMNGQLRAVKTLPRALLEAWKIDYVRELEILAGLRDVRALQISPNTDC